MEFPPYRSVDIGYFGDLGSKLFEKDEYLLGALLLEEYWLRPPHEEPPLLEPLPPRYEEARDEENPRPRDMATVWL